MNSTFTTALILGLLVLPTPALAHAPIMGIGGVLGGVLHALLIPEHGMSLVALGLALGREQQAPRHSGLWIFAAALTCGLIITVLITEASLAADVLVAATGILGLLVALAWVPAELGWVLAAIVALAFALDSPAEAPSTDEAIRMLIGSGLGAAISLLILTETSVFLQRRSLGIVARVLGSWIAAIAVLVLALRLVTRVTLGG